MKVPLVFTNRERKALNRNYINQCPDVVTGQHSEAPPARSRALTLDELAQRCHATPVTDANELAADIRSSRDASLS